MAPFPPGGGTTYGIQTATLTAGTTSQVRAMPSYTVNVLLRCPSTNTHNVSVSFQNYTAVTGDMVIRPGESVSIDISNDLMLKTAMGYGIQPDDFIPDMSYIAGAAAQTLYIDIFVIQLPKGAMNEW